MSVDTEAVLIVGLVWDDLQIILSASKQAEIGEMIDNGEINAASPSYDAPRRWCTIGYIVETDSEIDLVKLALDVAEAKAKFLAATGVEGKLYLTSNIS
jgi:hypothetical protein